VCWECHSFGLRVIRGWLGSRTGLDVLENDHEGPVREQRYSCTLSLTAALDRVGGQLHAPTALPPGKRPGIHFTGACVGPRVGLDRCGKSRSHRDLIAEPPSPLRVAIPTKLTRTPPPPLQNVQIAPEYFKSQISMALGRSILGPAH